MAEYIHLVGTEDLSRAASTMSSAADEMKRAAGWMQETLENNQRFLDDWLIRFEQVMEKPEVDESPKGFSAIFWHHFWKAFGSAIYWTALAAFAVGGYKLGQYLFP